MPANLKCKVLILLDQPYYTERKVQLLRWICARHSIPRDAWDHHYIYKGRTTLPKKKLERQRLLRDDLKKAEGRIEQNEVDCVVVGLGSLPCEFLTGASLVSTRAGTYWDDAKTKKFNRGRIWIGKSPDAALYNPGLVVQIARVVVFAAEQAGIETKWDESVPMFQWEEYEFKRH